MTAFVRWSLRRFVVAATLAVPLGQAQYHSSDPRLEKLYQTFISPCCWRENLTVHNSPVAQELRGRIRNMIQRGESDEQIKSALVEQYTKQILALPEGPEGFFLFTMPWLGMAVGACGLLVFLKRSAKKSSVAPSHDLLPAIVDDLWNLD